MKVSDVPCTLLNVTPEVSARKGWRERVF